MKRKLFSRISFSHHRFRQHRETAADPGEATDLGKTSKLHRAVERARNLENRVGNIWIRHIGFISGVKKQKGVMSPGVINPSLQLLPRRNCAGWIVRKTK